MTALERHGVTEHQVDAMQALFDLNDAINNGNLSIADMMKIIEKSIVSGHQQMQLSLAIASNALRLVAENVR